MQLLKKLEKYSNQEANWKQFRDISFKEES